MKRLVALILGVKLFVCIFGPHFFPTTSAQGPDNFEVTGEVVQLATTTQEVVLIGTSTNWTKESILAAIRKMFPEEPERAVAIALCENHALIPDQQSNHVLSYGREQSFGIFQIHAPDWHETALELGYDKYQSDVQDNLSMARYIYDAAGGNFSDWTCSRMI